MTSTNFPNGISSFGIPVMGGGGIPATGGNVYFVDYGNGSDGNKGKSANRPWKTVEYAVTQVTSGNDDVVVLMGSASHTLSAMLTVSKSRVHFVGMDASGGRRYGQNAKIVLPVTTAATDVFAMKNTGVRNSFHNIKFISNNTVTESIYCVGEGGEYAVYEDCEFYKSTDLDVTGAAELVLNGDSAQFRRCTIGSLADAVAGSSIIRARMLVQAGVVGSGLVCRDVTMEDCLFWTQAKDTTNVFINVNGAADVERQLLLKGCGFINNKAAAAAPAVCIRLGATLTVGNIVLDPTCYASNVTKIATGTGVIVTGAAVNSGAGIGTNAA